MLARLAALVFMSSLVACAEPEPDLGTAVDNHTEKDIDFQLWDAPVELTDTAAASVAYGECERVAPTDDNVDIQIHCGRAWTEVAWLLVPADTIAALPSDTLQIALDLPANGSVLRGSIHRVDPDGTTKLTSRTSLFDGDQLEATIEQNVDHYVYLGRGRSLINIWGTGEVAFTATLMPSGI